MRASALRRLRLGLPAVAVLAAALTGCGEPTPAPSVPPVSPSPMTTPTSVVADEGTTGSDGLTVRYLAENGDLKTVRVEDFPAGR